MTPPKITFSLRGYLAKLYGEGAILVAPRSAKGSGVLTPEVTGVIAASVHGRSSSRVILLAGLLALATFVLPYLTAAPRASSAPPRPDAEASREAFLGVYKVFTSPRCQNCHPAGDTPLQGDDSHVHLQNVKRGRDGHGVTAMRCETCHQISNLAGDHMPPGNVKWGLTPSEHRMVFVGRTPAELCRQLKDPKQTGGRSLQQLLEHVAHDELVAWGWNPGDGRALPPLTRQETVAQMKIWIDGGAACPE